MLQSEANFPFRGPRLF